MMRHNWLLQVQPKIKVCNTDYFIIVSSSLGNDIPVYIIMTHTVACIQLVPFPQKENIFPLRNHFNALQLF